MRSDSIPGPFTQFSASEVSPYDLLVAQPQEPRMVLFPHFGRTGGDCLLRTLVTHYNQSEYQHFNETITCINQLRMYAREDFAKYRMMTGHGVYYGLHDVVGRDCVYIGLMREPVQRALSQYYSCLEEPTSIWYERVRSGEVSHRDFQQAHYNQQSVQLLGYPHYTNILPTLEHIPRACEIIDRDFAVMGVTEMYAESIFMIHRALGWRRWLFYEPSRQMKQRPGLNEIEPEVLQMVMHQNQIDTQVYTYARNKFQQTFAALPQAERKLFDAYLCAQERFRALRQEVDSIVSRDMISALSQSEQRAFTIIGDEQGLIDSITKLVQSAQEFTGCHYTATPLLLNDSLNQHRATLLQTDDILICTKKAHELALKDILQELGVERHKIHFALNL